MVRVLLAVATVALFAFLPLEAIWDRWKLCGDSATAGSCDRVVSDGLIIAATSAAAAILAWFGIVRGVGWAIAIGFVGLVITFMIMSLKTSDVCPQGLGYCSPDGLAVVDRWAFIHFATVLIGCAGSITGIVVRRRRSREAQTAILDPGGT
ncbi:hypothetical protein J5Y09_02390 [Roseomonas sp. PWR1]|uniref:Methylamine utilization protein MauE n=1 Tax=Roseomonas nitratireducens TaxID=2820810 RepID=A0ABS4ANF9_9PROT|nr:hypothetical protein [Neoroseomonas nitratireducens]MBP0462749.1 hypothetical protein [Neoroseomonas nitratireducens]